MTLRQISHAHTGRVCVWKFRQKYCSKCLKIKFLDLFWISGINKICTIKISDGIQRFHYSIKSHTYTVFFFKKILYYDIRRIIKPGIRKTIEKRRNLYYRLYMFLNMLETSKTKLFNWSYWIESSTSFIWMRVQVTHGSDS